MKELQYHELKEGMELEFEDFFHSGILTWRKGVVEFADYGSTQIVGLKFPNGRRERIYPHRMKNVRLPKEETK